jgi:Bacteriophage tail sheath protein
MPAFTYPGVYTQELPSGVHPISGVSTSVAAFVGWASQGPIDRPALVTSWADFESQCGGLDPRSYLGYAVNQFFSNGGQQAYVVRLVADGTGATTAPAFAGLIITGLTFDTTAAPAPSIVTIATGGGGGLALAARNPGSWGDNYAIRIEPEQGDYARLTLAIIYTNPNTQAQSVVESFQNLSLALNDPQSRYAVGVINTESNFLTAKMGNPALTITNVPAVPPATLPPPGAATISLGGGDDGTVLNPAVTPGAGPFETALNVDGSGTGVHLLDTVPIINLLAVPAEADPSTIAALQAYCVRRQAFLIVDCEPSDTFATLQGGPNDLTTGVDAINSAFYFPWLTAFDAAQNVLRPFPPSGFVAGVYVATDASRGVWKAPAGIDAGLIGQTGLAVNLNDQQAGVLNTQAINCIRNLSPYGDVVWGARTLRGANQGGSEWQYVPIRRFQLYIEASISLGIQWAVFEPNGEALWQQIRLNVGAFMQSLFVQGAFQGATPAQAYYLKCDAENNSQSSIDNGVLNIQVGFAPLYPAEFVTIQIQQLSGQGNSWGGQLAPQISLQAQRLDPYKNFKFRLKWDGKYVAGFSKVSSLRRTTEVIEHRSGGDPSSPREDPGPNKFEAITLERGLTQDSAFNAWAAGVQSHGPKLGTEASTADQRKDIILELRNDAGCPVLVYKVYRCWVSDYQILPDLDANRNAIAIEHIKLENEGWEQDSGVSEPREPVPSP